MSESGTRKLENWERLNPRRRLEEIHNLKMRYAFTKSNCSKGYKLTGYHTILISKRSLISKFSPSSSLSRLAL